MKKKATRPHFLNLPLNRKPVHAMSTGSDRCFSGWLAKASIVLLRKVHVALIGQRSITAMLSRTKTYLITLICFVFFTILVTKLSYDARALWNYSLADYVCFPTDKVYSDGLLVCGNNHRRKYLSYQPPGGGWNNQRIAFENAVVFAKLLNRTLIVHPLAPHQEILRLKKKSRISAGYEVYNMLAEDYLLPLSKVIDLKTLSKLIPVTEVTSSHSQFLKQYRHMKWGRVCHNGLLGTWIDVLPEALGKSEWKGLQDRMNASLPRHGSIPLYRRICKEELKTFANNATSHRPVWSIERELANRNEGMLYFPEGSLYVRELHFFNKNTVRNVHEWIMRFVHFAPDIWWRVLRVLKSVGRPFSAIHVRRTDHPSSFLMTQDYWLAQLKWRKALNLTSKLYVATDENNKSWFEPFRAAGYQLFFADDFQVELQPKDVNIVLAQDIRGVCEQLICANADHFVGSYYSTFTMFIQRLRRQLKWSGGFLRKPYTTITWFGSDHGKV